MKACAGGGWRNLQQSPRLSSGDSNIGRAADSDGRPLACELGACRTHIPGAPRRFWAGARIQRAWQKSASQAGGARRLGLANLRVVWVDSVGFSASLVLKPRFGDGLTGWAHGGAEVGPAAARGLHHGRNALSLGGAPQYFASRAPAFSAPNLVRERAAFAGQRLGGRLTCLGGMARRPQYVRSPSIS